jgi:ABC-2 type transport system permease protein
VTAERTTPVRRKGTADRTRRTSRPRRTAPAGLPEIDPKTLPDAATRPVPRHGWAVVAAKEFADLVSSIRFLVLLVLLSLAAVVPLFFAAERIRDLATNVSGTPAIFLALFILGPEDFEALPPAAGFIAFIAPLMGVAFAFDAVNGERSEGTLPRLVSQPIYRDSVINGKFVAGLAMILMALAIVVLAISAYGAFRLGIIPDLNEVLRIGAWFLLTALYVSFWLAFGLLLSVLFRRAAVSALIGFGAWVLVVLFGGLIISGIAGVLAPTADAQSDDDYLRALNAQELIQNVSPHTIYGRAASVLLNPSVTVVGTPGTLDQYQQDQQRIPTIVSFERSLALVWPHVMILLAMTAGCFALAYVAFMRQEVRA